ncbi:hypothetical protein [Okeania sp.]|nr:hypothetical protein [Okeania sp.]MEB3343334.1 hypothetical protein [Okeania sp.]
MLCLIGRGSVGSVGRGKAGKIITNRLNNYQKQTFNLGNYALLNYGT